MRKYTNLEVYDEIQRIGETELFKILFGERYEKYNKRGEIKLWYRQWGQRTKHLPATVVNRHHIKGEYDCIVIRYTPYDEYDYQKNRKGHYNDSSEYAWSGYEKRLWELARDIMPYTYKEQIEAIGRPFYGNPNAEKGLMHFAFRNLGGIEVGTVYCTYNGKPKEVVELNSVYYDYKPHCFTGFVIETDSDIRELIFTVEKDGLILAKYDVMRDMNLERLTLHQQSYYVNVGTDENPDFKWVQDIRIPLCTDALSWERAVMDLSVEALKNIKPIIEYGQSNPEDINPTELRNLKHAKQIINTHAGWKGDQ